MGNGDEDEQTIPGVEDPWGPMQTSHTKLPMRRTTLIPNGSPVPLTTDRHTLHHNYSTVLVDIQFFNVEKDAGTPKRTTLGQIVYHWIEGSVGPNRNDPKTDCH